MTVPFNQAGLMNLLVKKAQEFMDSHADMTENHLFSLIDMVRLRDSLI